MHSLDVAGLGCVIESRASLYWDQPGLKSIPAGTAGSCHRKVYTIRCSTRMRRSLGYGDCARRETFHHQRSWPAPLASTREQTVADRGRSEDLVLDDRSRIRRKILPGRPSQGEAVSF